MAQLTKGLYGHEFHNTSHLFGLSCGQLRRKDLVHNGGWYNRAGEKLGWGDLSSEDLLQISQELEEGEIFIILPEQASFWNFVTRPDIIGSMAAVKPDVEAPGVDYVVENAMWAIVRGKFFYVDRYGDSREETFTHPQDARIQFHRLNKDRLRALLATPTAA